MSLASAKPDILMKEYTDVISWRVGQFLRSSKLKWIPLLSLWYRLQTNKIIVKVDDPTVLINSFRVQQTHTQTS